MLTPQDIEKKVFKRKLRGYSPREVESFLRQIGENYERLYKENIAANDRITMLSDAVRQYKVMEDTLVTFEQDALPISGDRIPVKAPSDKELEEMAFRYEQMKRSVEVFRAKVVSLLHAQLEIIKDYSEILVDEDTLKEARGIYEKVLPMAEKNIEAEDSEKDGDKQPDLNATQEIPIES